jgi:hypothetical protein
VAVPLTFSSSSLWKTAVQKELSKSMANLFVLNLFSSSSTFTGEKGSAVQFDLDHKVSCSCGILWLARVYAWACYKNSHTCSDVTTCCISHSLTELFLPLLCFRGWWFFAHWFWWKHIHDEGPSGTKGLMEYCQVFLRWSHNSIHHHVQKFVGIWRSIVYHTSKTMPLELGNLKQRACKPTSCQQSVVKLLEATLMLLFQQWIPPRINTSNGHWRANEMALSPCIVWDAKCILFWPSVVGCLSHWQCHTRTCGNSLSPQRVTCLHLKHTKESCHTISVPQNSREWEQWCHIQVAVSKACASGPGECFQITNTCFFADTASSTD